jgi:hypothetical protein
MAQQPTMAELLLLIEQLKGHVQALQQATTVLAQQSVLTFANTP